jgi:uncharacterized protein (TIGR03437 family)
LVFYGVLQAMRIYAHPDATSPLPFEPNRGQAWEAVRYLAHAPGYTLLLLQGGFAILGRDASILRVKLVGANRHARIEALDPLPGISNYFLGNDPAKWRTRIPHYRRIALRQAYPGIDLVFYGDQGELEYDWIVAPGADPKRIRLRLKSAAGPRIDAKGGLVVNAWIRQKKSVAYQIISGRKKAVESNYKVLGREIAFQLGAYDMRLPLVIDPALVYSTFLGGRGQSNIAEAIAVDRAGNAYITGYTDSPNFPVKGSVLGTSPGVVTPFVSKISPSGTLVYSTFLGGYPNDQAHGIAVDGAGNAYVVGITGSPNFPTANALQPASAGGYDLFLTKISPDGSKLLYSTYLGGKGNDYGTAIAVDADGNACVTGYTDSRDYPAVNAVQGSLGGGRDAFVTRINAAGSALIYSTYVGGGMDDFGMSVASDPAGNAYVTGYTKSTDLPTVNALQNKYGGALWNGFVTKLAADGSAVYSTYLGGKAVNTLTGDRGFCIAADITGNAYVEGYASTVDFPTAPNGPPGSTQQQTFVTKIDPAGGALVYTAYIPETVVGAASQERNCGIAVDLAGNAYVTGAATSAKFATTSDALQATFAGGGMPGNNNVFLTKLSADGSSRLYSTYLGGNHGDYGTGIAVRGSDAYLTGFTWSPDFPTTDSTQPRGPYGDIYVTRNAGDGPQVSAIVNAASGLAGPLAPGEWITISGSHLGPPAGATYTLNADGTVDSTLAGVQVLFDTIPGTPTYVSDSQINVIVPYEIADRASIDVSVIYQQSVSLPVAQTVRMASPAIYTVDSSGTGQARATNEDGAMNGPATAGAEPAPQGSILSLYGTGGGQTDPPGVTGSVTPAGAVLPLANWTPGSGTVTARIGGMPATVVFAGASPNDLTGVLRLDVQIPAGVAGDALPVAISIDGVTSPAGPTLAVR